MSNKENIAPIEVSAEEEEVFRFLFDLQAAGVTNMFDAPRWIMVEQRWHHIFKSQADAMVMKWMKNYRALRVQLKIDNDE